MHQSKALVLLVPFVLLVLLVLLARILRPYTETIPKFPSQKTIPKLTFRQKYLKIRLLWPLFTHTHADRGRRNGGFWQEIYYNVP